jgi:multidrug resistance efflux pump
MSFVRVSMSLMGAVGVIAVTLAGAAIWLLVTQPVKTADALGAATQGEVSPLVKALAGVLYDALQGLLKYL